MNRGKSVYLDSNATTLVNQDVLAELVQNPSLFDGNPSSNHAVGWETHDAVEEAREAISQEIGCSPHEILFTSGASEATATLFNSLNSIQKSKSRNRIVISNIEHKSVLQSAKMVKQYGYEVDIISVDEAGRTNIDCLREKLTENVFLCSIMHGNNEIGTINPIELIGQCCDEKGILFHTDASQTFQKKPIDVNKMRLSFISGSGHKFHAPKGVGFLYHRDGKNVKPLIHGGGQENGLRAGTENTFGIVFMGMVIKHKKTDKDIINQPRRMRNLFYKRLTDSISGIHLNGPPLESDDRLCNNLNISIGGVSSVELLKKVKNVQFSTGSACLTTTDSSSYVLENLGLEKDRITSACRFGFSWDITSEKVEFAVNELCEAVSILRRRRTS